MRLVIFTTHYPFGKGEEFLEEELVVAERYFEEIIIVTCEKNSDTITKYIPDNARVVDLIKWDANATSQKLLALRFSVFPRVWREILYGCRERGMAKLKLVIKRVLMAEEYVYNIKRAESKWENNDKAKGKTVYYSYWINPAALFIARKKDAYKGICIARAHAIDCFFSRGYVAYRKRIIDKLDGIFPISDAGKADIICHYGEEDPSKTHKIQTSRLGVKIPGLADPCKRTDAIRIVSCSSVIQLKRIDLLIDALTQFDDIKVSWIHFGDGSMMDQICMMAHNKLDELDNIEYEFRGMVSNNDIHEYYAKNNVDLFINCSDVEGIPVSIMEAMSYGIPSIARNVGGNAELVDDEVGCLLNSITAPEDIATAIRKVYFEEDGVSLFQRRRTARKRIETKFNAEKNYAIFFDNIHSMIKKDSYDEF